MNLDYLKQNPDIAKDITLQIKGSDLLSFADKLVKKTANETKQIVQEENKPEEFLTRQQVTEILNVSPTTLHNWNKNGVLTNLKIGNKVRYRRSDVESAFNERV